MQEAIVQSLFQFKGSWWRFEPELSQQQVISEELPDSSNSIQQEMPTLMVLSAKGT
jgi:hypothetical protein